MKIIKDNLAAPFAGANQESRIAIGNFDGVHKGHRKLLDALGPSGAGCIRRVVTFSPHPRILLGEAFTPIYSEEEKIALLARLQVCDELILLPFDEELRQMPGNVFFQELLLSRYHGQTILVGDNFRFGKQGAWDARALRDMGRSRRTSVEIIHRVRSLYQPISSSRIRILIREGAIKEANRMLVDPFFVQGVVRRGKGEGHRWDIPTINIWTAPGALLPRDGVYVSETQIDDQVYRSITNVGTNPTFTEEGIHTETYLLDFDRDIYGKTCVLRFLSFIRPEIAFENEEALYRQIRQDIRIARQFTK